MDADYMLKASDMPPVEWKCCACGAIGVASALPYSCNACGKAATERIDAEATDWTCINCGRFNYKPAIECKECGTRDEEPPLTLAERLK